jgi:hypothetical protein
MLLSTKAAGQHQQRAATVDPGLVPATIAGVIDIEALAGHAAGPGPLLEQRAAVRDQLDPVFARLLP